MPLCQRMFGPHALCTTNHTGGSASPLLTDHPKLGSTFPALSLVYSMLTPYILSVISVIISKNTYEGKKWRDLPSPKPHHPSHAPP